MSVKNKDIETGVAPGLGGATPNFMVSFGVTINLPRTKFWLFRTVDEQKQILYLIYKNVLRNVNIDIVKQYCYTFEMCKDGNVHLHGMIDVLTDREDKLPNTAGFVLDYAKRFYRYFRETKGNSKILRQVFNNRYYNDRFTRYKAPPLCIKYLSKEDRVVYYKYMQKDLNNGLNAMSIRI